MSLSLREKQTFYDQLGHLLRAGIPLSTAVDRLKVQSRGKLASFLHSLRRELDRGATVGEAFQNVRPRLSDLERTALSGLSRSGKMDAGLLQLSAYFGALHKARSQIIQRLLYPLFLLHFGVLALNAGMLVTAGWQEYLRKTGSVFLAFYVVLICAAVLIPFLLDSGAFLSSVDALLRQVPLVGKVRRSFAISRFCSTYDMQLDAGVNVIDSLRAAGLSSRSGLIRAAVLRALPELRRGGQVGPLIAASSGAFPSDMLRAFLIAEETGRLDQTLQQLATEYQEDAFRRLDIASEWIPRLIYVGITIYLGWQIVSFYASYFNGMQRQIDAIFGE